MVVLWQAGDSVALSCDLRDAKTVVAFNDYDLALRDEAAVDEKIDRIAHRAVEFDDAAGAEFNDVLEQHLPGSKAKGDPEFDIQEKVEIPVAGIGNCRLDGRVFVRCCSWFVFNRGYWPLGRELQDPEFQLKLTLSASDENQPAFAVTGGAFGIGFGELRLEFKLTEGTSQAVGRRTADLLDKFGCGFTGVAGDFSGTGRRFLP